MLLLTCDRTTIADFPEWKIQVATVATDPISGAFCEWCWLFLRSNIFFFLLNCRWSLYSCFQIFFNSAHTFLFLLRSLSLQQMLRFSIKVSLTLQLLTTIALNSAHEIVVLTSWTNPSTIREIESLFILPFLSIGLFFWNKSSSWSVKVRGLLLWDFVRGDFVRLRRFVLSVLERVWIKVRDVFKHWRVVVVDHNVVDLVWASKTHLRELALKLSYVWRKVFLVVFLVQRRLLLLLWKHVVMEFGLWLRRWVTWLYHL